MIGSFLRFWRRLHLTPRLILYMVVVAAIPLVLTGLLAFRAGSQGIKNHVDAHLTSVVKLKAQEVERWFRPLEASAQVLANSSIVSEQVSNLERAQHELATGQLTATKAEEILLGYFGDLTQRNVGLQGILVLSADRKTVLASTFQTNVDVDSLSLTSQEMSAEVAVHLAPYKPGEETPLAAITIPVQRAGTNIAHILLLTSPVPLYEMLAPDAGLGPGGNIYLVNHKGEVLTPPLL